MPDPTNTNMRAVGSNAAQARGVKFIRSFNIKKNSDRSKWYLYVNQKTLLGIYPGQSYAIDALYGAFTSVSGHDSMVTHTIDSQIQSGVSVIDPDINILTLVDNGVGANPRLSCTVELYDDEGNDITFLVVQESPDKTTWTNTNTQRGISNNGTYGLALDEVDENYYYRVVLEGATLEGVITELSYSNALLKDDVPDSIILGMTIDEPVELGGLANADATVSGVPYGVPVNLTYDWERQIPSLTGLSGSVVEIGTLGLDMHIDEPVQLNGFANASVIVGGVPEGSSANLTYDWERQIPSLTGLSVELTD